MIKRLRPAYTPEQLKEIYAKPHSHDSWEDHRIRVKETVELGKQLIGEHDVTAADLSCGDAAIINALPFKRRWRGDYAPGFDIQGPLETTIQLIDHVNVFILCETLEHLDDPFSVLKLLRGKADKLILSTPIGETTDENPEHYWGWDKADIHHMLLSANWSPVLYRETPLKSGWYQFQIWGCE